MTKKYISDTPVFEYSDLLNGSLNFHPTSSTDCRNYFKIDGNEVYVIKNLMNDCRKTSFTCKVSCSGVQNDLFLVRKSVPTGLLQFKKEEYVIPVTENTSPIPIFDFSNQLNQTDCYTSTTSRLHIKNNGSGPFVIFDKQVRLVEGSQLDYDSGNTSFTIEMEYTDDIRVATTKLIVNVKDVDDMDPVFNNSKYIYQIFENTVNADWQLTVPKVSAYDKDFGDGRQNLSYSFQDGSVDKGKFAINKVNGRIKVLQPLDREQTSEYDIILKVEQVNNPRRSATASLSVRVKDQNDNLPEFKNEYENVNIDEHASFGTFLCELSATDKDLPPFDETRYHLKTYSNIFYASLDPAGNGEIRVNDSSKLDRETLGNDIYLTVIAVDATNDTEGGNMTLIIKLHDINDNQPIFTEPHGYNFLGNSIGIIGQVNATDEDSSLNGNGVVTYEIPFPHPSISIDKNTGVINLTHPLSDNFELYVEACDSPVQQSSRRCSQVIVMILVTITDIVDVELHANISENVRPGTIVKFIDIKGSFYEIIGENSSFTVGKTSGVVSTFANIDREDGPHIHTVNIHVLSKSSLIFANISLQIKVLDVNDNPPVFENNDNFFELPDPLSQGADIGYISATDKDSDDNGAIQYIIPETITSRYFSINETTGNISLVEVNLPHGKEFFQLIIIARDKGNPPLQSSCNIYISRTFITDLIVRIEAPLDSTVLKAQRLEYERKLSQVLSLKVTIEDVRPKEITRTTRNAVSQPRSFMDISAKNLTGSKVPSEELQRIVLQNMEGIQLLFLQENSPIALEDSTFTASQIGLVVLAAIILVGGILATIFIFRKKRRPSDENSVSSDDEEKAPINNDENQVNDTVSMQSIEVAVDLEEERIQTSDYDSSQNSNEQAMSESSAVGTINPAFQNETETLNMSAINVLSTTDEAEQHLNQLNDLLNMEENQVPNADYEIVDAVTDHQGVKNPDDQNAAHVSNGTAQELFSPKATSTYGNKIGSEHELLNPKQTRVTVNGEVKDDLNESSGESEVDYENSENENKKVLEGNKGRELDQESEEFIMSSKKTKETNINYSTTMDKHSYEHIDDVLDEEPDIDYNDKQVRFSTVVLDSEENKLEPLKLGDDDRKDTDFISNGTHNPGDSEEEDEQTAIEPNNDGTNGNVNEHGLLLDEEEVTAF
ncbi:unnamed protein product [Mytilus coruscus]|uniref:Cadherin domain-containing protein n=1 Tax=Mytilus coruscus TaxID=42192 RepID=A0A6J8E0U9_MYTCO|nr:unnamed protein product [Mytilus coruscus]